MIDRIRKYFETLETLSSEELDRAVEKLTRAEKKNAALVIAHLAEMGRRKAAIARGYKSLFDYCVRRLNLSEGSVALRLQVASIARRFPQILEALAENRVSLSVAGLLAPHLTEENADRLLADCAGKTKRATEEYLVSLRPKPVFEPSIRKRPTTPEPLRRTPPEPPAQKTKASTQEPSAPKSEPPPLPPPSPPVLEPATPEQFNFRFTAGREFKEKLERLAEVLGIENAPKHMAEILDQALEMALDKKDPKRKLERRREREAKNAVSSREDETRPDEECASAHEATSRYLSSEVRERVHARAGYRCEYRGSDGTRCASRTGLEIEHDRPFARFRSHDERFLRLFCRAHNRLTAERAYGVEFIQRKIDETRSTRCDSS